MKLVESLFGVGIIAEASGVHRLSRELLQSQLKRPFEDILRSTDEPFRTKFKLTIIFHK